MMNGQSNKSLKQVPVRFKSLIVLLISVSLLTLTQLIANFSYWFKINLDFLKPLQALNCVIPGFCNLRFPPYGFIAFLSALFAAILFGGWLAWQKIPNSLIEPGFHPVQFPSRNRFCYQVDGMLIAVFVLCQVYVIVQSIQDQSVFPGIWLVGLLTLFLIGWRLDQSQVGAPPWRLLSPTFLNVLYVAGIALSLLTTSAFHSQRWLWFLVFGTAMGILWALVFKSNWQKWDAASRLERLTLPLITLGSFLLFSYELDGWQWSFIGDEYSFYDLGKSFADGTMTLPILSGAGVYGVHPVLSSVWQGVTMWLFGADGYGWRVSNSLLLAMSIPFFYYFLRPIIGRLGGLFAVTLYGSAHVLISLGHYGCNNAQIIIVMAVTLSAFMWAGRRGSWAGFAWVGLCLGLGFYLFAVARIYSLIIAIWLAVYYFPVSLRSRRIVWPNIGVWFTVVGTAFLTALPVLSTRSVWAELARQTVLTSNIALTPYDQFVQILRNTLYGLTAFLFNDQNGLWIFGAHSDPITGILMAIGLTALLLPSRQTWRVRVGLVASSLIFVIVIAGTQQHDYPNITRIFSFVPFYAIFAAVGLLAIGRSIMSGQTGKLSAQSLNTVFTGSVIVIATMIVLLNIWQNVVLSQRHSAQGSPAFLLQTAQMSEDATGNGPHLFYVADPQDEYWDKVMYSIYDIPLDRYTFVLPRDALLPNGMICQSADRPAIVMVTTEIQNAGYIAAELQKCWDNSELRVIKDVRGNLTQYRLINKSALPFIHSVGGYWTEEELPQTTFTQSFEQPNWVVYQPVGLSRNSHGQTAVVEEETDQVVFLDSTGRIQNILENEFIDPSDICFFSDDSFVVADAGQGLLWFDPNGHFRFKSDGGASPRGVFAAADGTVYIASTGGEAIIQAQSNGKILRIIKGPQFQQPTSVAVALDGRIAVGDPVAGKVTINSSAGELLFEYPIDISDTVLGKPGLLWLQDGSFIYTDPANNRIVWVDPNGKTIKKWTHLKAPTDIILQSTGKLLVLESRDDHLSFVELK